MLLATLLLLSLSSLAWAALPSFLANLEEDSTYHKCDSAMCWWTTFDIEFVTDFRVPNSSLVIADYEWNWWEVKMSSLLDQCAPSLPLSQVAYSFSACNDIDDSSIEEACIGVQRDWLDEKGEINTSLMQMYSEMPKAESFINECLALDGDGVSEVEEIFDYYDYSDYYDYNDYYYYYYNDGNDLVEEKSGGRQKRSLGELKATVKQREKRRGRARKEERNEKVVEKQRKGKKSQKRRRTKHRKGAKKKITTKRNTTKKKKKGKARKEKKTTKKGKKETKSKKKSIKKERREAKRALKKIGLKKAPSQLVLAQLKCIWLAVDLALEDCGKEVLKNSNMGNS